MFRVLPLLFVSLLAFTGTVDLCSANGSLSDEIDLADQSLDSTDLMIRNCRMVAVRKFISHAANTGKRFTPSSVQFEGAQRVFWTKQIELRFNALFFNSARSVGKVTIVTYASENNVNDCR